MSSTAPEDYTAQTEESITIDGSSATVVVEIVVDSQPEGEETFSVSLTLPVTDENFPPRLRLGMRTTATVVISDRGLLVIVMGMSPLIVLISIYISAIKFIYFPLPRNIAYSKCKIYENLMKWTC